MVALRDGLAAELRVPPGKKELQIFDDVLQGFGIRKFSSGKASYFVKFNIGLQQRKIVLGNALAPRSCEAARKRGAKILADAKLGIDTRLEIDARKAKASAASAAATMGDLVRKIS